MYARPHSLVGSHGITELDANCPVLDRLLLDATALLAVSYEI